MPRNQAVSVAALATRFLSHLETQGSPRETVRDWRTYVRRLGEFAAERPLADLDLDDLDDFIAEHYGGKGYHSRKGAVIALRAFYKWAEKRGHAPRNVAADLDWPRRPLKETPTFYRPEQVPLILHNLNGTTDRLAATLLVRHGQRISPTLALRWRDIDFGEAVVRYPANKTTRPMVMPLDKETGREFKAWKALTRWSEPEDWVFVSRRSRLSHRQDDQFREALRDACLRAGVPYRGAHELRRTCATTLLMNGVPLHVVSKRVLGHSSEQTTLQHYAGSDDLSVADALKKLPF